MKAGRVIGRVVSTCKYKSLVGRKILLLKPMEWEEVAAVFSGKKKYSETCSRSVVALDAVGAGSSEYVFYVSSKEACQAFPDDPICHNAVIGIIDGINIEEEYL
ncbi:MAG: EutN/CcmL family microcompartment protein [Elusimicrobiota bacterium]